MTLQRAKSKFTHFWGWFRFKPGTRARRAARQLAIGVAAVIIAQPRYAIVAKRLLAPFPSLKKRLRPSVLYAVHRNLAAQNFPGVDEHNIEAEPEAVREIYHRLGQLRRHLLAAD